MLLSKTELKCVCLCVCMVYDISICSGSVMECLICSICDGGSITRSLSWNKASQSEQDVRIRRLFISDHSHLHSWAPYSVVLPASSCCFRIRMNAVSYLCCSPEHHSAAWQDDSSAQSHEPTADAASDVFPSERWF